MDAAAQRKSVSPHLGAMALFRACNPPNAAVPGPASACVATCLDVGSKDDNWRLMSLMGVTMSQTALHERLDRHIKEVGPPLDNLPHPDGPYIELYDNAHLPHYARKVKHGEASTTDLIIRLRVSVSESLCDRVLTDAVGAYLSTARKSFAQAVVDEGLTPAGMAHNSCAYDNVDLLCLARLDWALGRVVAARTGALGAVLPPPGGTLPTGLVLQGRRVPGGVGLTPGVATSVPNFGGEETEIVCDDFDEENLNKTEAVKGLLDEAVAWRKARLALNHEGNVDDLKFLFQGGQWLGGDGSPAAKMRSLIAEDPELYQNLRYSSGGFHMVSGRLPCVSRWPVRRASHCSSRPAPPEQHAA